MEELITEDGLCIMSCGMGWQRVVGVLLHLQLERRRDPREKGIVLILGCTDQQRRMIVDEVNKQLAKHNAASDEGPGRRGQGPPGDPDGNPGVSNGNPGVYNSNPGASDGNPGAPDNILDPDAAPAGPSTGGSQCSDDDFKTLPPTATARPAVNVAALAGRGAQMVPPSDITADTPAVQRSEMYRNEAAVFVTTRILVVDMLSARLLPHQVRASPLLHPVPLSEKEGGGERGSEETMWRERVGGEWWGCCSSLPLFPFPSTSPASPSRLRFPLFYHNCAPSVCV